MNDPTQPLDPIQPADIDALLDTFGKLHAELEQETRYRHAAERFRVETERVVRRSNQLVLGVGAILALFFVYAVIAGNSARRVTNTISDCVNAPAHPHPAGTPAAKLTCYERAQRQTGAAVNQIRDMIDATVQQRLLEVLEAARTGKPVTFGPPPTLPPTSSTTTTTTVPRQIGAGRRSP